MMLIGGRKVDFDWLLDIAAGVSWNQLQNIILNPENCVSLEISTQELEVIWKSHLKIKPTSIFDFKVPGEILS